MKGTYSATICDDGNESNEQVSGAEAVNIAELINEQNEEKY